MHSEEVVMNARLSAKEAWVGVMNPLGPDHEGKWSDDAFEAALRAYMTVLASNATKPMSPMQEKAVAVNPIERTPGEHFLALCSGHYEGYTLTSGMLPDRIARKMICFQPDPKSSILYPLFISLMHAEMENVVDLKGNPFLIAISGGEPLTVIK